MDRSTALVPSSEAVTADPCVLQHRGVTARIVPTRYGRWTLNFSGGHASARVSLFRGWSDYADVATARAAALSIIDTSAPDLAVPEQARQSVARLERLERLLDEVATLEERVSSLGYYLGISDDKTHTLRNALEREVRLYTTACFPAMSGRSRDAFFYTAQQAVPAGSAASLVFRAFIHILQTDGKTREEQDILHGYRSLRASRASTTSVRFDGLRLLTVDSRGGVYSSASSEEILEVLARAMRNAWSVDIDVRGQVGMGFESAQRLLAGIELAEGVTLTSYKNGSSKLRCQPDRVYALLHELGVE